MRCLYILMVLLSAASVVYVQSGSDLPKLVETEKAFAKAALDRGTRAAFLEFLADDGVVFQPGAVNGKDFWTERAESSALLSWDPVWADISANGEIGYTTGGWEYRPAGKNGDPVAFGEYITIWQKQVDGQFKAVLDIGVSHDRPEKEPSAWASPKDTSMRGQVIDFKPPSIHLTYANYKKLVASDVRVYRDSKFPLLGKSAALKELRKESENIKSGAGFDEKCGGVSDLRFCYGVLELTKQDDSVEMGNLIRIWKFRNGKWQIVLEVFTQLPEKK